MTNRWIVLRVVLAVALAASCGGAGGSSPSGASGSPATTATSETEGGSASPSDSGNASPSQSASPSGGAAPSAGEGEFLNPVIDVNMPDPFVLDTGELYYLYSTTNIIDNYPYATSEDLVNWEQQGDAMPRPPSWSNGNYWAPEVTETSAGYVMYFTARAAGIKRPDGREAQCIGVAVAETPDGPFVDESDEPLVCQADLGGTIDGSVVRDADDALWLIYKNDGNCCSMGTRFFMRRMSEDGLTFAGDETEVEGVINNRPWEGRVIEAPTIWFHDGTYYLFFSANDYASAFYAVGYATSDNLTGPYEDAEENPILKSESGPDVLGFGPGHQTIIEDRDGDLWMVYHAWERTFTNRQVWIDELVFEDGKAVVQGPDIGPQPIP